MSAELRIALEQLRPSISVYWDGDGAMTLDDAMRSLRLMGEEIIPAMREMAKEFDLPGPSRPTPPLVRRWPKPPSRRWPTESRAAR